jgi:hypothetical protein
MYLKNGIVAIAFVLSGCSVGPIPTFPDLDGDHDGRISLQEARGTPELSTRFALVDQDLDGQLTASEYLRAVRSAGE